MAEYSDTEATQAEEWRMKKLLGDCERKSRSVRIMRERRVNYADFDGMSDNGKGLPR